MISLYMLCLSRRDDYIAAIGAESLDPHVGPPSYAATHGRCREMARSLAPTFYKTDNSRRFDLLTSRSPSLGLPVCVAVSLIANS